jgi:hypothetical protein
MKRQKKRRLRNCWANSDNQEAHRHGATCPLPSSTSRSDRKAPPANRLHVSSTPFHLYLPCFLDDLVLSSLYPQLCFHMLLPCPSARSLTKSTDPESLALAPDPQLPLVSPLLCMPPLLQEASLLGCLGCFSLISTMQMGQPFRSPMRP